MGKARNHDGARENMTAALTVIYTVMPRSAQADCIATLHSSSMAKYQFSFDSMQNAHFFSKL